MNIDMHGKPIQSVTFMDNHGNTSDWWRSSDATRIELSVTHHGDHDEHWVLLIDRATGEEVARRRAGACDEIEWVRP